MNVASVFGIPTDKIKVTEAKGGAFDAVTLPFEKLFQDEADSFEKIHNPKPAGRFNQVYNSRVLYFSKDAKDEASKFLSNLQNNPDRYKIVYYKDNFTKEGIFCIFVNWYENVPVEKTTASKTI